MRRAFVTGGTGFLGINLIHALIELDWHVTALHRPDSNLTPLDGLPVRWVQGSITSRESLIKAIYEDIDVVFHLAGDTSFWSKNNLRQFDVNVNGTKHMIDVCTLRGIQTFIHTSSISAWGRLSGLIDETTAQAGGESWLNYEKTKWLGEQEALKGRRSGMKVVILNPASIVGPYDKSSWGRIFLLLQGKKLPGIPPGENNFVHVNDVVEAHLRAVDQGRDGHNYIIGGENLPIYELIREIVNCLEPLKMPPRLPSWLLKSYAAAASTVAIFTGKEPSLTPESADLACRKNYRFSNAKALQELGYKSFPWRQGIHENYSWLEKEGLLTGDL